MKKQLISLSIAAAVTVGIAQQAQAVPAFVVQNVEVQGLQRINPNTVQSYLPIQQGQQFNDSTAQATMAALRKSGLFSDVKLFRRGDTLVVQVQESRPIGDITIKGNKAIPTEGIQGFLKQVRVVKGSPLDTNVLAKVQEELQKQYISMGYNNAKVSIGTTQLSNNRAGVVVDIKEGSASRIQKIQITGNRVFPDSVLLKQFDSGPKSRLAFFSDRDLLARDKIRGDLDKLRQFYLDRGYLNFDITSTDVQMSKDKRSAVLNISIREGQQYRIGSVSVEGAGIPQREASRLVTLRRGQVFSQTELEKTRKNLQNHLGGQGFAFTKMKLVPKVDEANKLVHLVMKVDQGKRTYVRRINIRGNERTNDNVIRREMRQLESSWFSREKIEKSKLRIQRLPYIENVKINAEPVAGTKDQVDINVIVSERSANQFQIGAGYSQSQGFLFNVGVKQQNFMGTGKEVDVNLENSSSRRNVRISYNNPYYTPEGISRGFEVYYKKYNAEKEDISGYVSNRYGGKLRYSIPIGEDNAVHASVGAERREIVLGDDPAASVESFVNQHGEEYTQYPVSLSYVHDSRNRAVFPTEGQRHRVSVKTALPGSDIQFYKLGYTGTVYRPITEDVTFKGRVRLGAGDGLDGADELPFFEKYTAGGIGTVRGFDTNSLGPKEGDDHLGGDALVAATAEVQFPVPFMRDNKKVKMSAFVDAGNVFAKHSDVDMGDLRVSAGLGATWLSPFGPLEVSYAKPLNAKDGDEEQRVQFSIGASF